MYDNIDKALEDAKYFYYEGGNEPIVYDHREEDGMEEFPFWVSGAKPEVYHDEDDEEYEIETTILCFGFELNKLDCSIDTE